MAIGVKVMLPAALVFIALTGGTILVLEALGIHYGLVYGLVLTGVNLVACVIFFWILDRDRVIAGASATGRHAEVSAWHAGGVTLPPRPPASAQLGD